MVRHIDDILAISARRKGSVAEVLDRIAPAKSAQELVQIPDNAWLSAMSRSIFQAGFNWKVVDRMWPGFEDAFQAFDPGWCAMVEDERFDQLLSNTAIVRHGPKIRAVAENASFVQSANGFGSWVGGFGSDRFSDLLLALKQDGTRLGGTTGQYFLRHMGVDGWILSRDVSARLIAEGVVDKITPSKKSLDAVQAAFSEWQGQSGYSLKEISRILATSTG